MIKYLRLWPLIVLAYITLLAVNANQWYQSSRTYPRFIPFMDEEEESAWLEWSNENDIILPGRGLPGATDSFQ